MGRKAADIDKELLAKGLELAQKFGINGFSIRNLCKEAGVNLGMFHYYFKSRHNFNEEVMKYGYSHLVRQIETIDKSNLPPRENIKTILLEVNLFAKQNRKILSAMAGDALSGDKTTIDFIIKNFTKHIELIIKALSSAKGLKDKAAKQHILSLTPAIFMPVAIPQLLCGLMERTGNKKMLKFLDGEVNSDKNLNLRIDMLLDSVFEDN